MNYKEFDAKVVEIYGNDYGKGALDDPSFRIGIDELFIGQFEKVAKLLLRYRIKEMPRRKFNKVWNTYYRWVDDVSSYDAKVKKFIEYNEEDWVKFWVTVVNTMRLNGEFVFIEKSDTRSSWKGKLLIHEQDPDSDEDLLVFPWRNALAVLMIHGKDDPKHGPVFVSTVVGMSRPFEVWYNDIVSVLEHWFRVKVPEKYKNTPAII